MKDLQEKLASELVPEARILVCRFPLPQLQPIATVGTGMDRVWVYRAEQLHVSQPPQAPSE